MSSDKHQLEPLVRKILAQVQKAHKDAKSADVKHLLNSKRDAVLQRVKEGAKKGQNGTILNSQSNRASHFLRPLLPTAEHPPKNMNPRSSGHQWISHDARPAEPPVPPNKLSFIASTSLGEHREANEARIPSRLLKSKRGPLPKHVTCITIAGSVKVDDTKNLTYVPYLGDNYNTYSESLDELSGHANPKQQVYDSPARKMHQDGRGRSSPTTQKPGDPISGTGLQRVLGTPERSKMVAGPKDDGDETSPSDSVAMKSVSSPSAVQNGSLFELYDTSYREQILLDGAEYDQHRVNRIIDAVLQETLTTVGALDTKRSQTGSKRPEEVEATQKKVASIIAVQLKVRIDRVKLRLEKLLASQQSTDKVDSNGGKMDISSPKSSSKSTALLGDSTVESGKEATEENLEGKAKTASAHPETMSDEDLYLEWVDSYRTLYCRRCYIYDCPIHGLSDKTSLQMRGELQLQNEMDGSWRPIDHALATRGSELLAPGSVDPFQNDNVSELSTSQKALCKRFFLAFEGNTNAIAYAMRAPRSIVEAFIGSKNYTISDTGLVSANENLRRQHLKNQTSKISKNKISYHSVRNYNQTWYNAIEKAEIHPFFYPCSHEEPCSQETCSCITNNYFCTRACGWSHRSRNFFRGCDCKGQCVQNQCSCWAARRECDPDLCLCGPCSDPPGRPATDQQCRNDNLAMRRHCRLIVGESSISGWGLYTKHALSRGDFIIEYVGEVISQEEAERRGQIDDTLNRSYMFNLCSDRVIDASRKANKARFINHSDTPNCQTKTVYVKGDQRIGLFASKDIPAQTELFFDYRYNVSMDNDRILKPAFNIDWVDDAPPTKKPAIKKKKSAKRRR